MPVLGYEMIMVKETSKPNVKNAPSTYTCNGSHLTCRINEWMALTIEELRKFAELAEMNLAHEDMKIYQRSSCRSFRKNERSCAVIYL